MNVVNLALISTFTHYSACIQPQLAQIKLVNTWTANRNQNVSYYLVSFRKLPDIHMLIFVNRYLSYISLNHGFNQICHQIVVKLIHFYANDIRLIDSLCFNHQSDKND